MSLLKFLTDPAYWDEVGKHGRDLLRSTSNAAQATFTAPVDLINLGLGLAGAPVSKRPIGGTEWLKQLGLYQDVPEGAAKVAGETLGGVLPVLAPARSPELARGILQMIENAQAPVRASSFVKPSQRGAVPFASNGNFGLTNSLDDAKSFASQIESLGPQYKPNIIQDRGGSVYVTVDNIRLKKDGTPYKRSAESPTGFKARFADHPSYWGSSISSDPTTMNTADNVFQMFLNKHQGAPLTPHSESYFVPQEGFGEVTDFAPALIKSWSGKSENLRNVPSEARPFSWIR